jgi:hypothetical protein
MQDCYYLSFRLKHSPVPLVGGGCLSLPCRMILLLNCYSHGGRPIRVATKAVGPSGGNVVLGLPPLMSVGDAVMVGTDWMEPMQTAVGTHVMHLLHLGLPAHAIAAVACAGTAVGVQVLVVGHLCGHGGNGGIELLDLALHRHQFFLPLHVDGIVCHIGCASTR